MKTKFSFLFAFAFIGAVFISSDQKVSAQSGSSCGEQNIDYKKRFLVSGCKRKAGDICVIRCDQPNMPTISI
ncbi:hypothetical protein [Algoriphagus sp. Y33]|uniref:hypothetical protein n=1 Tax=Algoriphagus sp. Y33 TaxID=2772483 RepID=UPI001787613A|nr:hypothetical protein [Algoriphagus sp. Y33]